MKHITIVVFYLITSSLFGQSKTETYKFSNDLLTQIEQDSVAWKYQTGATELSFSGYYKEVMQITKW